MANRYGDLGKEFLTRFERGIRMLPQPTPRAAAPIASAPPPAPAEEPPEEPPPVEEPAEEEPALCEVCMKAASESGTPFMAGPSDEHEHANAA